MATKGDDRMKCSHCGEEIKDVTVHRFTHDGADTHSSEPILGGEDNTCYYLDIDKQATMFEFEDSYEDFIETISCPKCDKFPFSGSISIYQRAHVVFGISKEKGFE
jgi:hypothetical protein